MHIRTLALFTTVALLSLMTLEIEARGGGGRGGGGGGRGGGGRGGGGRGGGGGAYRGGHVMNRTPSISRPANRPVSQARPQAQRPQTQQRPQIQQRPQTRQRPQGPAAGQFNRQQATQRVQQFSQQQQRPSVDRSRLTQMQNDFNRRLPDLNQNNRQLSNRVSNAIQDRPNFDRNFFERGNFPGFRPGVNWWGAATWGSVASWLNWGYGTPYYYDASMYPYEVAYPAATDQYAAPTQPAPGQPAAPAAQGQVSEGDWMPLGVFAVAQNAEQAAAANRFLQLALNRSGEIQGVFYNALNDKTQNVTGLVDKGTQQVYFQLADSSSSPIATTGLYNLTADQTPLTVNFTDGSQQTWTLVRLEG